MYDDIPLLDADFLLLDLGFFLGVQVSQMSGLRLQLTNLILLDLQLALNDLLQRKGDTI